MQGKLNKTVFFIGFMGAGKTTVARKMAKICSCECVDMDYYVERITGKKVREIFAEGGEEAFRKIEAEVLEEVSTGVAPRFISCGGGTVLNEKAPAIMHENGVVLHLYSDASNSARRISDTSTRPLFKDVQNAKKVFRERLPIYEACADYTVDTTNKWSNQVTKEVFSTLVKAGVIEETQE